MVVEKFSNFTEKIIENYICQLKILRGENMILDGTDLEILLTINGLYKKWKQGDFET